MRRLFTILGVMLFIIAAHLAQFERMHVPASTPKQTKDRPVVTGSLFDKAKAQQSEAVRIILAQASEVQHGAPPPAGKSSRRAGGGRDDPGELHLGGTGLLDGDDAAAPKVPHPLEAANPSDYVVICEAGCRPLSDRIVYRVSKLAATQAAIAAPRLEPTSAPEVAGVNEAVCIAGCYDSEPAAKPLTTGSLDAPAPGKSAHAVLEAELAEDVNTILASAMSWVSQDQNTIPSRGSPLAFAHLKPVAEAVAVPAVIGPDTRAQLTTKRTASRRTGLRGEVSPLLGARPRLVLAAR